MKSHYINIFKNTFKNIYKSWSTYIVITIYLVLSIYLVIIRPWFKVLDGKYGGNTEDLGLILMINWIFSALLFTYISSLGARAGTTIFFLSRPIQRKVYFWSRWTSVLLNSLFIAFLYISFWFIIHSMIYNHNFNPYGPDDHHVDIFDKRYYTSISQIIVPLLLLTIPSSTIGIVFKYSKYSLVSMLLAIFIGFIPMFYWFSELWYFPPYEHEPITNRLYLIFPSCVFGVFSIFSLIFMFVFSKYMKVSS